MSGDRGLLALPRVVAAQRKEQGVTFIQRNFFIQLVKIGKQMAEKKNTLMHAERSIADAENNGTACVSTRKMISLKETNTCNNVNCTSSYIGNILNTYNL